MVSSDSDVLCLLSTLIITSKSVVRLSWYHCISRSSTREDQAVRLVHWNVLQSPIRLAVAASSWPPLSCIQSATQHVVQPRPLEAIQAYNVQDLHRRSLESESDQWRNDRHKMSRTPFSLAEKQLHNLSPPLIRALSQPDQSITSVLV